ncbi:MAG TPA: hypothetical protein VLE19_17960 [Pyrinomonadaceae bacterium]|nr:hypothetical protein [Pyrinomonadaceae bacterium]
MKTRNHRIRFWSIATMVLPVLVVSAQQFDMQPGAEITQINPAPVIRVRAIRDAEVYDTIDASDSAKDLAFHVKIRGSCPETYRLAGLTASINNTKLKQRREIKLGFNPDHRSIGPDHGAGWDFTLLNFPFLQPETPAATSCNQELDRRVSMGESKTELLRKGFELNVPGAYRAFLDVTCHKQKVGFYEDPNYVAETRLPLTIRCMPSDYKPPRTRVEPQRTAVPDPPIESVSVSIDPIRQQGCPVDVTFRGRITTPEKTDYSVFKTKYRFLGENNFKSDWIPVSVARGETKTVTWRRLIEAPETTGSFKTPGSRTKIPLYRGWMAVEVMLPTGTKRSERTDFTIDCNIQNKIRARP